MIWIIFLQYINLKCCMLVYQSNDIFFLILFQNMDIKLVCQKNVFGTHKIGNGLKIWFIKRGIYIKKIKMLVFKSHDLPLFN